MHFGLSILALAVFVLATSMPIAKAESGNPVKVDDGIWIEAPIVRDIGQDRMEAYVVINNRTDRALTVNSISSPGLGEMKVLNGSDDDVTSSLLIPHHSELFMQPGGIRIQFSLPTDMEESKPVVLMVAIGPYDPVTVNLEYIGPDEPIPDHHDYEHCDIC